MVSWEVLRKVFNYENDNLIRGMHKITKMHVFPDSFQKMSVKLAVQVFSWRVSTAIYAASTTKLFEKEEEKKIARDTAEFFGKLNTLFDHLNSTSRFSDNPDNKGISQDNNIIESLRECVEWISKWEKSGKSKVYCFNGLVQTINGIISLWETLQIEQEYLLTSHLNQDALENTFSIIRNNHGSYERNPSCARILTNLKQILFHNLIAIMDAIFAQNTRRMNNPIQKIY